MKKTIIYLLLILCSCMPVHKQTEQQIAEQKTDYENIKATYKVIATKMALSEKDTICDVAGGFGYSSSAIANYLPASTIYFEEDINMFGCRKRTFQKTFESFKSVANIDNFNFKIGTKKQIPFATKSFKNITLFISIHEFTYKEIMLDEVRRIMRDDGKLFLMETVYKDTLVKDKNCGFTYISDKNLHELINNAKLQVISDTAFDNPLSNKSYTRFMVCAKNK
ncbi:MAG: class I SAM-dependent methyltransferase [Pedobacter sp.]|nr:class I SAM-dependent methyltransferase [Chitinophagaceae bacterium]